MRIPTLTVFLLFSVLLLTGCAAPTEVPFDQACNLENDGKTIITTGQFTSTASVYCSDVSGKYRCGLDFVSPPSAQLIGTDLVEGDGRNQVAALPDSYTDADFKITADDGTVIGLETPARITGKMIVAEGVCAMYVDKVEVIP